MKKKLLALSLALALTLTACGNQGGGESKSGESQEGPSSEVAENIPDKELTITYSTDLDNMDYVTTALNTDHQVNGNLVDGLLENSVTGKLVPSLAESWEPNEDKTVWTFKIRPNVQWVTNTGEVYDTVKADDFVVGVRHGAEFESETAWLLQGVVKGYDEYLASDFSDEAWDKVGVKAIDDSTLEFTLEQPTPYFDSMTTYAVLYPINRAFLEGQGEGCKLGAPNKDTCDFGATKLDSILYNGAFILTENTAKSQRVMTKNAAYWDAANVHLSKVTEVYDDGSDNYSTIKGFENGVYSQASLNPGWADYDAYKQKYEGKTHYSLPNGTAFGVVFNYNRQVFNETNYATDETLRKNTREAVLNENFRKALRAAYDVVADISVDCPKDLAEASQRNINNAPDVGTLSDGTIYPQVVTDAYNEATGENRDLNDGKTPFFSKEEAMKYIEAAKEEGVVFPVHLDMMVIETSDRLVKKAQSMKKSIEDNTEGNIIIELVMRPDDTVTNIVYKNSDPAAMDYDISTFTGWSPDYNDPKSFVDIYSPITGYYMRATGLGNVEKDKDGNQVIVNEDLKKQLGFMDYEKLYRDADKITDDMDARYKAFAKADALLIEKCLYIPTGMKARFEVVSKYVPFTRQFATYGLADVKWKGLQIADDIIPTEEYDKAYEEWQKNFGK
ncbi:MAG: peptide ABC transporter substrate-binding protein [Firmicutes bacterium]|nr:peptide ABC transporter substrate-binding protein [Bacillota bacterium]